jgi:hypothetical protein
VDGQKLRVFDVAAERWSELPKSNIGVNAMEWSRDSRYVYFDTHAADDPSIYRMRISDRNLEPVASVKDLRRAALPFDTWIGFTPDGSPLLMRDTGTQDFYCLDFEET